MISCTTEAIQISEADTNGDVRVHLKGKGMMQEGETVRSDD